MMKVIFKPKYFFSLQMEVVCIFFFLFGRLEESGFKSFDFMGFLAQNCLNMFAMWGFVKSITHQASLASVFVILMC